MKLGGGYLINNIANSNSDYGISLRYSSNNTPTGNIVSGNRYTFDIYGDSPSHYIQNIDTSNLVDGEPIYYWID